MHCSILKTEAKFLSEMVVIISSRVHGVTSQRTILIRVVHRLSGFSGNPDIFGLTIAQDFLLKLVLSYFYYYYHYYYYFQLPWYFAKNSQLFIIIFHATFRSLLHLLISFFPIHGQVLSSSFEFSCFYTLCCMFFGICFFLQYFLMINFICFVFDARILVASCCSLIDQRAAVWALNPLNPELNPICYLLALLGAHHFLHVSRISVKSLTLRLLMSYIWSTHSWCF